MKFRLSKTTCAITAVILLSSFFASFLSDFLTSVVGRPNYHIAVKCLFLIFGIPFAVYVYQKHLELKRNILFALVLCFGVYLIWYVRNPEERLHLIEFGLLGWLTMNDHHESENARFLSILFPCAFVVAIGALDELIQLCLPYRVGEMKDFLINAAGGAWGIVMYSIYNPPKFGFVKNK